MLVAFVLAAVIDVDLPLWRVREEMLDRLRIDTQRQIAGASWTKERIDTDIQDPHQPKLLHTDAYRIWGDGGGMFQQKTSRNGKPLRGQGIDPLAFFIGPSLFERFEIFFGTPKIVIENGRHYWHLAFQPRDGAPKGETLEQELIGASAGVMLVDIETYGIVRINAELVKPRRSFLFDVQWSRSTIRQALVDGTFVTQSIEMEVCFDTLWGGVHTERHQYRYFDFVLPPARQ